MGRVASAWLIFAVAVVCLGKLPAFGQEPPPAIHFLAIPPHGDNPVAKKSSAVRGATAAPSLPMWNFTTTASRDGNTYTGTMIGRSPFFHGARTTNIDTVIVPLKMTIHNVSGFVETFDPTTTSICFPAVLNETPTAISLLQESPLSTPANFTMNGVDEGITQYVDAYQRANFHSVVDPTGDRYHLRLNVTVAAPVSVTISGSGAGAIVEVQGRCGDIGVVDGTTFDSRIQTSILPLLTAQGVINSRTLPIFLLSNVVLTQLRQFPNQQNPLGFPCCVLGYHSGKGSPPNLQFYAVADFDSNGSFSATGIPLDVFFLSHEIAELVNDPLVQPSGVPQWHHSPQVPTCQSNLEVADPIETQLFPSIAMPNGVSYHLTELAYFSWFFGAPSIAANGAFSDHDSLTADAGTDCLQ